MSNVRSRAPKSSTFYYTKKVGSLHRNWRFGRTRSHVRHRSSHETLHTGPSHHHIRTCKLWLPSNTECQIACAQIPSFLLYENVGSLHRNWRFGRTRSHVLQRMAMKLCTHVIPSPYTYVPSFKAIWHRNVKYTLTQNPVFYYTKM